MLSSSSWPSLVLGCFHTDLTRLRRFAFRNADGQYTVPIRGVSPLYIAISRYLKRPGKGSTPPLAAMEAAAFQSLEDTLPFERQDPTVAFNRHVIELKSWRFHAYHIALIVAEDINEWETAPSGDAHIE